MLQDHSVFPIHMTGIISSQTCIIDIVTCIQKGSCESTRALFFYDAIRKTGSRIPVLVGFVNSLGKYHGGNEWSIATFYFLTSLVLAYYSSLLAEEHPDVNTILYLLQFILLQLRFCDSFTLMSRTLLASAFMTYRWVKMGTRPSFYWSAFLH